MYDRVLFPTDGSEGADAAVEHALAVARQFGIPIHVLYVVDATTVVMTDQYAGPAVDSTVEALEEAGEDVVERTTERAREAGVDATGDVTEGTPASAIVDAAEDGDVIVMGTHGRTGLERYLVGSTTEKVVRTADVPVVTVPVARRDEES